MLLLWTAPAGADLHITPFVGVVFAGNTNILDLENAASEKKLIYGGTVGVVGDGPLGLEGEASRSPSSPAVTWRRWWVTWCSRYLHAGRGSRHGHLFQAAWA
jgi:hypothetical protein